MEDRHLPNRSHQDAQNTIDPGIFYVAHTDLFLWEKGNCVGASRTHSSLTLVAKIEENLVSCLSEIILQLTTEYSSLVRWHTHRFVLNCNRLQIKKFIENMQRPLPGYSEAYLDMPDLSSIPCQTSRMMLPFSRDHWDTLQSERNTLLIMDTDYLDLTQVATLMRPYERSVECSTISDICRRFPNWLLGRGFVSCTHCVWQFIGSRYRLQQIIDLLDSLQIRRVEDGSEPISTAINEFATL